MLGIERVQAFGPADRDDRDVALALQFDAHLAHAIVGVARQGKRGSERPTERPRILTLPGVCPVIKQASQLSEQFGYSFPP